MLKLRGGGRQIPHETLRVVPSEPNSRIEIGEVSLRHETGVHELFEISEGLLQYGCRRVIWIGGAGVADIPLTHECLEHGYLPRIHERAAARGVDAIASRPPEQYLFHQHAALGGVGRGREGLNQAFQRAGRIAHHGLVQTVRSPISSEIREHCDIGGDIERLSRNGVEAIDLEPHVLGRSGAAIGPREAADLLVGIAVGINGRRVDVGRVDGRDAEIVEEGNLLRRAHTVAIAVAPDPEAGPQAIIGVDSAVHVVVPRGQGSEAVGGNAAASQWRLVPEQLRSVVDAAIAISVPDQETVVWPRPTAPFPGPVALVIERHAVHRRHCFHAVPVEVEHDRRDDDLRIIELLADGHHPVIDP